MITIFRQLVSDMDITENARTNKLIIETIDENIHVWIEQEAIHLKAIDAYGDPVELTGASAKQLATKLLEMADRLDD